MNNTSKLVDIYKHISINETNSRAILLLNIEDVFTAIDDIREETCSYTKEDVQKITDIINHAYENAVVNVKLLKDHALTFNELIAKSEYIKKYPAKDVFDKELKFLTDGMVKPDLSEDSKQAYADCLEIVSKFDCTTFDGISKADDAMYHLRKRGKSDEYQDTVIKCMKIFDDYLFEFDRRIHAVRCDTLNLLDGENNE